MGYGAQVCLNVLQLFRGRQKFSTFLRSSVKLETCSLGLFIGLYNALFRVSMCKFFAFIKVDVFAGYGTFCSNFLAN